MLAQVVPEEVLDLLLSAALDAPSVEPSDALPRFGEELDPELEQELAEVLRDLAIENGWVLCRNALVEVREGGYVGGVDPRSLLEAMSTTGCRAVVHSHPVALPFTPEDLVSAQQLGSQLEVLVFRVEHHLFVLAARPAPGRSWLEAAERIAALGNEIVERVQRYAPVPGGLLPVPSLDEALDLVARFLELVEDVLEVDLIVVPS